MKIEGIDPRNIRMSTSDHAASVLVSLVVLALACLAWASGASFLQWSVAGVIYLTAAAVAVGIVAAPTFTNWAVMSANTHQGEKLYQRIAERLADTLVAYLFWLMDFHLTAALVVALIAANAATEIYGRRHA